MEEMCEAESKLWEELAEQEWERFRNRPGETQDSVTGEILEPGKVKEGCDEETGCLKNIFGEE